MDYMYDYELINHMQRAINDEGSLIEFCYLVNNLVSDKPKSLNPSAA